MTTKQDEHIKDIVDEVILEIQDDAPVYATVEKVTPGRHDKSWWIKWFSSIMLIMGALLIQNQIVLVGTSFAAIGVLGWTWVGILWNDHALIVMNALFLGIYLLSVSNKIILLFGA